MIAFTSEFIPRLVYILSEEKPNLEGYIKYTLSAKNLTDFGLNRNNISDICMYKDFKYPFDHPQKYQYTPEFYKILAARLIFIVCFEHIVFSLVALMHLIIPNTPRNIKNLVEREKLIVQKIKWESKENAQQKNDRNYKINENENEYEIGNLII